MSDDKQKQFIPTLELVYRKGWNEAIEEVMQHIAKYCKDFHVANEMLHDIERLKK
jgi:hypothetical protein